jgi:dipeptidyl aminopeptidase/acylaminoacyl peptidase
VDPNRIGVYGLSAGACLLPIHAVGERRLKAAVLGSVGLFFVEGQLPEADPFNFLSRFRVPTLMIDGRTDFIFPLESSQRPMFQLLGTPEKDKNLVLLDGGHGDLRAHTQQVMKEALAWFDRYLGPVK